jgi:hypothetical protein
MARLLQRTAELRIGDRAFRGLDLEFTVDKRIDPDPNTLDLVAWNLSEDTRAAMQRPWLPIVLVAGYEGTAAIVFSGQARRVEHSRAGVDVKTRVLCGDGEKAFQIARSHVSFAADTALSTVVEQLAKDLGVQSGDALARLSRGDFPGVSERYLGGYTASGPTVRELDRVLRAAGIEWSIQDGKLQLLAPGEATSETAVLLSPESGLVDAPEHGAGQGEGAPKVLKARSLLQPGLRPGRLVRIESKKLKSAFRVVRVVHMGELAGQKWYSEIEAVEATA